MTGTTSDERRLTALLPFVHDHMPPAPARVLEIGCGPVGGFVPSLISRGYDAVGVDPEAPAGAEYHRVTFEEHEVQQPVDAIVACTALHHVADIDQVLGRVVEALAPRGTVIVVEWAHEWFNEATARWCFEQLPAGEDREGWLHHHRDRWEVSGLGWDSYLADWIDDEELHTGESIIRALDARFERRQLTRTPYFFADLDDVSEVAEQAAIDAHTIRPTGIRYVGQRRTP
jgi:SAM-dependent methyltransferase